MSHSKNNNWNGVKIWKKTLVFVLFFFYSCCRSPEKKSLVFCLLLFFLSSLQIRPSPLTVPTCKYNVVPIKYKQSGTHWRVGDAPARVRAPVGRAVPAGEATRGAHEPPSRLHLLRGVHGTWPPRVVFQLQHLGRWVVLPVKNLDGFWDTV